MKVEMLWSAIHLATLAQKTACAADQDGDNSPFIFVCYTESVSFYPFNFVLVVPQRTVNDF